MISNICRKASRWIFFGALAYAPWAYGATTSESINITNCVLLVGLVLWGAELLTARRRPRVPSFLLILTASLLCIGGWMVLNAKAIYDSEFSLFVQLRNFVPFATGSLDYPNSVAWMLRGMLLLGTILFVSDLSQSSRSLLRLWYVIGLVGGSIAFLGLLQKATGARMIFWQPPPADEQVRVTTFFATYFYHGNAGAFLNLVWPLTAGLVIRAFTSRSQPGMRALWIIVFLVTIAGVAANTSRMAQVVALVMVVAIGGYFGPGLLRRMTGAHKGVAVAGSLAIILALIALAQATHLEQPLGRWQLGDRIPTDARWQASRVALGALPGAGFLGSGPGTFRVVFPSYNIGSGHPVPGSWRFLHEDYLQTVIEWGWLGSILWALLFFGAIAVGIISYKRYAMRDWLPRRRVMQPLAMVALGGAAMHALVDFPFQIESLQLYVATYLGVCWGSSLWHDRSEVRCHSSSTVVNLSTAESKLRSLRD